MLGLWQTCRDRLIDDKNENRLLIRHRLYARVETRHLAARRLLVQHTLLRRAREQRHVLAAQRFSGVLLAESKDRDGSFLCRARDEVVEAGVTPELDLLDGELPDRHRIVQRDDLAGAKPAGQARAQRETRRLRFVVSVHLRIRKTELPDRQTAAGPRGRWCSPALAP